MKSISHVLLIGFTLIVLLCTGCVGRRNALESQERVRDATLMAKAYVTSQMALADAEFTAHTETRDTLRSLYLDWSEQRLLVARAPIDQARSDALLQVETNLTSALEQGLIARLDAEAAVSNAIDSAMQPLDEKLALAEQKAIEAGRTASASDLDSRFALAQADREYLGIFATNQTKRFKAERRFREKWNAAQKELVPRLHSIAQVHRAKIEQVYKEGLNEIAQLPSPALNLGSNPTNTRPNLETLMEYLVAVETATETMRDYLQSNSLGKGSYFYSAIRSFKAGLLSAIPIIGSGKGATIDEVKHAGTALLEDTLANAEAEMKAAGVAAKAEYSNVLSSMLERATGFLKESVMETNE